jgi:protein-L-isoaspartate(D-aspartate) O-methyltransferase
MLNLEPSCRVLEIGTGSGYQTAILSRLCEKVYTVEVVPELSDAAKRLFETLGCDNIEARTGNGYDGWPEHAPYDGIIVTAAATYIPTALIDQLKPDGRLVIPLGQPHSHQELMLVEKGPQGEIHTRDILGVAFVPMVESKPGGNSDQP